MTKFPQLICAADIETTELSWMWHPYIPYGAASMIFGAGGLGKSWIGCEIAAAVSSGRNLPGQVGRKDPRKVLILSAEDDLGCVIRPRLEACNATLKNIFIPKDSFTFDIDSLKAMEAIIGSMSAAVVFIDPMVAYMGGKIDMNKMNEVRTITGALHQIAQHTNTAIVIVHHSRKGSEGQSYEKAAGSADFINAVRSVLYVSRSNDGGTIMQHVKSNYAKYGKTLAYQVEENQTFSWAGEFDDGGGALLTPSGKKREQGKAFLQEILKHGPVRSPEVIKAAQDEGIAVATLHRAKVGVAESIVRFNYEEKQWFWRLEGDEREPTGVSPHPRRDPKQEAEEWLAQTDK